MEIYLITKEGDGVSLVIPKVEVGQKAKDLAEQIRQLVEAAGIAVEIKEVWLPE